MDSIEDSIKAAQKYNIEQLNILLKAAIMEAVALDEENKRLRQIINNIRRQVNCDDT